MTGLEWELLSHKLATEDPEALLCVQSVCNDKASIQMAAHEMQHIAHLHRICLKQVGMSRQSEQVALVHRILKRGIRASGDL